MAWRRKNTERVEHTHEYTSQKQHRKKHRWEACRWNASSTTDFVRDYLGPRLQKDHPSLLLFVFDHNRDHLVAWGDQVYGD